ncbi:protein CASC3 [Denticeps clupeoides]|uniref:Protein CASC3 n=1 Tax=Denticeps clupeoides TaxID=299321 RepID=A0AAY4CZK5_9TELE|nr:protein CASC3 [Denticeps clupeoides]
MADRRRRRRRASQDSEDEDESGSGSESGRSASPTAAKPRVRDPEPEEPPSVRAAAKSDDESECESEDGAGDAVLSDYDSADPEENGSHSEGGEDEEEPEHFSKEDASQAAGAEDKSAEPPEEEQEEAVEEEVKPEDKGNVAGERQSGDGQESTDDPENKAGSKAGQKLDDDEDRKNPAYIPRKGLFFEHDVRGQAQEEERPKGRHRKLWKDEGRWEHDKFREEEQAPKSREELIAYYGYDIRNGTGPSDGRPYRTRKPRHGSPQNRDKRWRDGEKLPRSSWQGNGDRSSPQALALQSGPVAPAYAAHAPAAATRSSAPRVSSQVPPGRSFQGGRAQLPPHRSEGRAERGSKPGQDPPGSRGPRPHPLEGERAPRMRGGRAPAPVTERNPAVVVEDIRSEEEDDSGENLVITTTTYTSSGYHYSKAEREPASAAHPAPRKQENQQPGGRSVSDQSASVGREPSPPPERPVERKSYSAARRTRARPSEMGKQASLEEQAAPQAAPPAAASSGMKSEQWQGQGEAGSQGGLSGLDQGLARLSLSGQNWTQSPPSYLRTEMRGLPNSMHMGGGPPQYNMEEMVSRRDTGSVLI